MIKRLERTKAMLHQESPASIAANAIALLALLLARGCCCIPCGGRGERCAAAAHGVHARTRRGHARTNYMFSTMHMILYRRFPRVCNECMLARCARGGAGPFKIQLWFASLQTNKCSLATRMHVPSGTGILYWSPTQFHMTKNDNLLSRQLYSSPII